MKLMLKNNELVKIILVIIIFTTYGSFPESVRLLIPLIIGVYFGYKTIIAIYKKEHWDEIMRMFILFIWLITGFTHLYNSAYPAKYDFEKITLLILIWMLPAFSYTIKVTSRRNEDIKRYKYSVLLFNYCIGIGVIFTIGVILKSAGLLNKI
ncbi:MAG: hypothetical protein K0M45_07085 [Candidatus Paracaedibacteraceae bacterium]|jgi:hypothetical protein|nr:hypothetical protein [Candidatus Paracaedibacteraceae bacterium]